MTARRFLVTGRVQGVGFRYFVESQARRLGVRGWVRNRHDGSVEVLAVASEDIVGELRALLGEGPAGAKVLSVVESAAQAEGDELTRFMRLPTR